MSQSHRSCHLFLCLRRKLENELSVRLLRYLTVFLQRSPEKDENLEFTRCEAGNIETSQSLVADEDVTGNQMEMTRNYENWEKQEDLRASIMAKTLKNCIDMPLESKVNQNKI